MEDREKSRKCNEILSNYASNYASHEWLPPLLQLVPFGVGSAIDSLLGNRAHQIKIRRLHEFIDDLSERLLIIDEEKIDKAFFETDEFFFHCQSAFRLASSEREIGKIKYFADLFIRGICSPMLSQDLVEAAFSTLSDLTTADIEVLHTIWQIRERSIHKSGSTPRERRLDEISGYLQSGIKQDFPSSWVIIRQNLLRRGLIELGFWNGGEYSGMTLSSYGSIFIQILTNESNKCNV